MANPSSIAFNSRNPRSNLPPSVRAKLAEVRFQNAFLREWLSQPKETGVGGSQFELPNFGIADYIWANAYGQIDAFEFKLQDWKAGLMQAMRYRGYARRSFLVVPNTISNRIMDAADAIRLANIGVYAFDPKKREITLLLSPVDSLPLDSSAYGKALGILNRKRKFRQIYKQA